MCSASSSHLGSISPGDPAQDRIVEAACRLIAELGVAGTSVRAVAEEVGVSAPLVIHHFGSKAGLVEACDRAVVARLTEALVPLVEGDAGEATIQSFVSLLGRTPVLGYLARSLPEGGEAGAHLFDQLFAVTMEADAEMRARGVARPTDDPQFRALLLIAMDLGMVLLRSHAERHLGDDLLAPETVTRWVHAELDVLRGGVLTGSSSETLPDHSEDQP